MLLLVLGAFVAGMLTVLAPCVLALLPIIIGGSVTGSVADKKRPIIIAISLAASLITFTLLLKATTLFINIPPSAITAFSGGIIVALGIITLFPSLYAKFIGRFGIEHGAQSLLGKGFKNKNSIAGPIIIGAALGPVFSSCSPVYAYILATVLPVNFGVAMIYIVAYVVGLSAVLLLIGYYGQRFVGKIKFASDPKGWFQRAIAILFIIVGLMIMTGYDKKFQTWISEHTPFNFDALSSKLIPTNDAQKIDTSKILNVTPSKAPEFVGLQGWINSDPQTIASLKGKVVLVDFWTYSCINCIRNNPYLIKWYEKYKDQGFVVIGVHAPEFAFEKVRANVETNVKAQNITYPVALDNDFSTWNAYGNQYWPAGYLIDAEGNIRRIHYGEGEYKESEEAIRALLQEKGAKLDDSMAVTKDTGPPITSEQTAETYLGSKKASNFNGSTGLAKAPTQNFTIQDVKPNYWSLGGTWQTDTEKITARGNSTIRFNVNAKNVYVVASSPDGNKDLTLRLDGKPISSTGNAGEDVVNSKVTVGEAKLYRLVKFPKLTMGSTLEMDVPEGVELNVFTFGS